MRKQIVGRGREFMIPPCIQVLAIAVWLLATTTVAHAAIIYDITISPVSGNPSVNLSGSGQIDFMGDLSTDGDFTLQASDITAFSLTYTAPEGTVMLGLADLDVFTRYRVAGGELTKLDMNGNLAQGSGGCPDFSGNIGCSLSFFLDSIPGPPGFPDLGEGNASMPNGPSSGFGRGWDYTLTRAPVPAPSAMVLFATGLVGLIGWNYRKMRR